MRGRKSDPAALQALKSNSRKQKKTDELEDAAPPLIVETTIDQPSELSKAGVAVWQRLAPVLSNLKFLKTSDTSSFAVYCNSLAQYMAVTNRLDSGDLVYETDSRHGKMKRIEPLFLIQQRLIRTLNHYEAEFGLTPSSRQRIMTQMVGQQGSFPLVPGEDKADTDQPGLTEPEQKLIDADPVGFLN